MQRKENGGGGGGSQGPEGWEVNKPFGVLGCHCCTASCLSVPKGEGKGATRLYGVPSPLHSPMVSLPGWSAADGAPGHEPAASASSPALRPKQAAFRQSSPQLRQELALRKKGVAEQRGNNPLRSQRGAERRCPLLPSPLRQCQGRQGTGGEFCAAI